MRGFIKCNIVSKNLYTNDHNYLSNNNEYSKYEKWNLMRRAGLFPYPELDIYVNPIYGAWMGNINTNITNPLELLDKSQHDLDRVTNIPFIEFINEGYELVIGPAAPQTNGIVYGTGVYCKNWMEIINKKEKPKQYMIG